MSEVIEAIVRERNNPTAPIQIFWVGALPICWLGKLF